jgi:pteridine reductase
MESKVALVTGAGRRIGAEIARFLHKKGMNVVIHYLSSAKEAKKLAHELNDIRSDSAAALKADLDNVKQCEKLVTQAQRIWRRLDVLVNNASRFYPTPMGNIKENQWEDLINSNLKSAFFLSQATVPFLAKQQGCIVNIIDIYSQKPLQNYSIYCIAKSGLAMLTKTLAKELGPKIRVNAVSPGSILWPEDKSELDATAKAKIISNTVLKRQGKPEDITKAVWFFIDAADYITGQVLTVDGGRLL